MTYIPKDPMCWVQVPRLNQRDWGFRKLFLCKGSPAPNKLIILLTDAPDYEAYLIMWSFTCFIGCLFNTTIADGKIMIWKGEHNCWFHCSEEASAKDKGHASAAIGLRCWRLMPYYTLMHHNSFLLVLIFSRWFARMRQRHIHDTWHSRHPFRIRDQQRQCQSNQVEAMQLWWYHTVGQLHLRRRSEAPIRTARSACTSAHRLIMPKVSPIYYQEQLRRQWRRAAMAKKYDDVTAAAANDVVWPMKPTN